MVSTSLSLLRHTREANTNTSFGVSEQNARDFLVHDLFDTTDIQPLQMLRTLLRKVYWHDECIYQLVNYIYRCECRIWARCHQIRVSLEPIDA